MNAVRDERLSSLEDTMEERTGRLSGAENRLDQQERHTDLILATNNVREERLSSLEGTIEERTGRLLAVESGLGELQRRVAAQEPEMRETIARHSDRAAELETLLLQHVELRSGLAEAAAGLASLRAEQQRLQAVIGEVAELRATIEKALYALALLQESLQGIDADLSQSRLSRIEAELSSVSASGEKPNSSSLI
jgi:chromosome segregation ATPase